MPGTSAPAAPRVHRLISTAGYACRITGALGVHEFHVRTDHAGTLYTHHIAVFCTLAPGYSDAVGSTAHHQGGVESNDSSGHTFLRLDEASDPLECSPLVRRCLDILCGPLYSKDLVRVPPTTDPSFAGLKPKPAPEAASNG